MYSTDTVGVVMGSAPALLVPLKQQLLFWDRIAIADLERMLESDVRVRRAWPNAPEDVEWLREQSIVFHVPVRLRSELLADPGYRAALEAAGTATEEYKAHADVPNLGSHLLAKQLGMISRSDRKSTRLN